MIQVTAIRLRTLVRRRMTSDDASEIDNKNIDSVERLDFLLTLIAKLMVDRDFRSEEVSRSLEMENDRSETAISSNQIR